MHATWTGGLFSWELIEQRPGLAVFKVANGKKSFKHEAGGHRWQRVPPTERRGRVHTSTVTVSVLPLEDSKGLSINQKDVSFKFCRGSGAGGQHRNTTDSACIATHDPTGLSVRCEGERSQHRNKELALQLLSSRLAEQRTQTQQSQVNQKRKKQVGTGMRGDKRRTVALQRGTVTDHLLKKKTRTKQYLRGELEVFYK